MSVQLTTREEQLLRSFPDHYRDKAINAIERGYAFCPSCHFAGHMNCAHFDECDAFISPRAGLMAPEDKTKT
jgi:hypothetical protein